MEPVSRSTQVLKQEAEDIGLQMKDIAEYVTRQQTVWTDAQKMQKQADVELAKVRAEAEEKRRADEIHMAESADGIKIQIAEIEAA